LPPYSPSPPSPPPTYEAYVNSHEFLCRVIRQSLQASEVAFVTQEVAVRATSDELDLTRDAFDGLKEGIKRLEDEDVDIDLSSLVGPDGADYLEETRSAFLTETCTDADFCEEAFDDAAASVKSELPFVIGVLKKYEIDTSTLTIDDLLVGGTQADWGSVAMTIGAAQERLARASDETDNAVILMRKAIADNC